MATRERPQSPWGSSSSASRVLLAAIYQTSIAAVLIDARITQEFLKSKGESVSGKKADLVERVADWLASHA